MLGDDFDNARGSVAEPSPASSPLAISPNASTIDLNPASHAQSDKEVTTLTNCALINFTWSSSIAMSMGESADEIESIIALILFKLLAISVGSLSANPCPNVIVAAFAGSALLNTLPVITPSTSLAVPPAD